jgi:hypothetical protein
VVNFEKRRRCCIKDTCKGLDAEVGIYRKQRREDEAVAFQLSLVCLLCQPINCLFWEAEKPQAAVAGAMNNATPHIEEARFNLCFTSQSGASQMPQSFPDGFSPCSPCRAVQSFLAPPCRLGGHGRSSPASP